MLTVSRNYTPARAKGLRELRERLQKMAGEEAGLQHFKWLKELYYARIPSDYWGLELDALKTDGDSLALTEEYIGHLSNAVTQGLGIAYMGSTGVGKTSLMCEVGKAACFLGIPTVYLTLAGYITAERERDTDPEAQDLWNQVYSSRVILLDEVDKVYIKAGSNWVGKQFIDMLKLVTTNGRALLMAMNIDHAELSQTFGDAVASAIERKLKIQTVQGDDYSTTLQQSWKDRLKQGPELTLTPAMLRRSIQFEQDNDERLGGAL